MRVIILLSILATSCTKPKEYTCTCRSQQNEIIATQKIKADSRYNAKRDCKILQGRYNNAGVGFIGTDCSLYN